MKLLQLNLCSIFTIFLKHLLLKLWKHTVVNLEITFETKIRLVLGS